jgi:hypothetical protein
MDVVYILDKDLVTTLAIDNYLSLVAADRLRGLGDFELVLPYKYDQVSALRLEYFLAIPSEEDSDEYDLYIITDINPEEDSDRGATMRVRGKSAGHILTHRVIPVRTYQVQFAKWIEAYWVVYNNLVATVDPKRAYPNFTIHQEGHDNINWGPFYVYTGIHEPATIFDMVEDLCLAEGKGHCVKLTNDKKLVFKIIHGVDRSYEQTENPFVVFSRAYDNVESGSYFLSVAEFKNLVYVLPSDESALSPIMRYFGDEPEGHHRREVLLSTNMVDEDFVEYAEDDGDLRLFELLPDSIFEGKVTIDGQFKYGRDFFLGDWVQCIFSGYNVKARVVEHVRSNSNEGKKSYISFDFD